MTPIRAGALCLVMLSAAGCNDVVVSQNSLCSVTSTCPDPLVPSTGPEDAGVVCRCVALDTVTCGNGRVEPGEACDDGNTSAGDGCYQCQRGDCTAGDVRDCGPIAKDQVGICRKGTQRCIGGTWESSCPGAVEPADEVCNGRDDNCDGTVDEGVQLTYFADTDGDGYGAADAGVRAACSVPAGYSTTSDDCNDTPGVGRLINPGATEVCDSTMRDENCNGAVNEGCQCPAIGANQPCCGTRGTQTCQMTVGGAEWSACSVQAMAEWCNGVDDDCNGAVDNLPTDGGTLCSHAGEVCNGTCGCPGGTSLCGTACITLGGSCTTGVGACLRTGNQVCRTGVAACDAVAGTPTTELCNGVDDNCNGTVDEGDPGGGATCATGVPGVCGQGVSHCTNAAQRCTQTRFPAASETCNGLDDNCNGTVDEGNPGSGASCTSTLLGACAPGTIQCQTGALRCVSSVAPVTPNCNQALDLDCNGTADNQQWTVCNSAADPANVGFNGCTGRQCAGTGACLNPTVRAWQVDADHDGSCVNSTNRQFCDGYPLGAEWKVATSCRAGNDCNDGDVNVYTGAPELADGRDNNCNNQCEEGLGQVVYSMWNPGDRRDNIISYTSGEAGWYGRDSFFTYNNAIAGLTVATPMVRCVQTNGRHVVTQGANNCTAPNVIEGYFGYLLAAPHTGGHQMNDCYTNNGGWAEMTTSVACSSAASGDGVPWLDWPGGFGYAHYTGDGCWAP
jgi:hypothetical protein